MRNATDILLDQPAEPGIEIRPVGIDDFAHVRYIHATAFRLLATPFLDQSLAAACERFQTIEYTEDLMGHDLSAAWVGDEMVGTAGWLPSNDQGISARITSVYVRPLYTRLGIGRSLVRAAEARARSRGYRAFSVRTPADASGLFERLGYEITSHGALPFGSESLPLAYLRRSDAQAGERVVHRPPAAAVAVAAPPPLPHVAPQETVSVAQIMADAAAVTLPQPVKFFRH